MTIPSTPSLDAAGPTETFTAGEIAEHKAFLAKITANYRAEVMKHINPLSLLAVDYELKGLERSAQEEGRFAALYPDPDDA